MQTFTSHLVTRPPSSAALNDGVDDDDSVAREQEDDDFANAPTDSPFDNDELDDSELFDMDED